MKLPSIVNDGWEFFAIISIIDSLIIPPHNCNGNSKVISRRRLNTGKKPIFICRGMFMINLGLHIISADNIYIADAGENQCACHHPGNSSAWNVVGQHILCHSDHHDKKENNIVDHKDICRIPWRENSNTPHRWRKQKQHQYDAVNPFRHFDTCKNQGKSAWKEKQDWGNLLYVRYIKEPLPKEISHKIIVRIQKACYQLRKRELSDLIHACIIWYRRLLDAEYDPPYDKIQQRSHNAHDKKFHAFGTYFFVIKIRIEKQIPQQNQNTKDSSDRQHRLVYAHSYCENDCCQKKTPFVPIRNPHRKYAQNGIKTIEFCVVTEHISEGRHSRHQKCGQNNTGLCFDFKHIHDQCSRNT